jgi:glycosyltransferase involved in cell wall biosynthesis
LLKQIARFTPKTSGNDATKNCVSDHRIQSNLKADQAGSATMTFSIITPSFRASRWLKLCIASVADQQGVELEHIVQDSCSDDGTGEWLPKDARVKAFIEKDQGMYDAVNRGFKRAKGDILAYLNCDEQYLPGALKKVHEFFAEHPGIDVVVADTVVTDPKGGYLCSRYALRPYGHALWVTFPVLTCALFVRRKVVDPLGICFDTQWKDLGDLFWAMEFVKRGLKIAVLPEFTSVFADTGENMNLKPNAIREKQVKWEMAPAWVKRFRYPILIHNRLRILSRAGLFPKPFDYSIYTLNDPNRRTFQHVAHPTSFWRGRLKYAFGKIP